MNVTRNGARRLYGVMGLVMAAIVVVGFSRTYYLKPWFDTPPLSLRLHLHGLVMTFWLILFIVQARLISVGRRRLHMSLGVVGVVLAVAVVAVTLAAAIEAAQTGGARGGITAVDRMYSNVLVATVFALFFALGVAARRHPELHKRLLLLATISVIGPGVTRAVALFAGHGISNSHIAVESVLVLIALIYDWCTRGRPHWVLLSGGLLLVVTQWTRRLVGGSEAWAHIGNWLIH